MNNYNYWSSDLNSEDYIEHHGTLGQKWGVRRYQYEDGSLTPEGRRRYLKGDGSLTRAGKKELERRNKILDYGQTKDFYNKYYNSTIYGENVIREGLSKEQYDKYKKSGIHDNWDDYKKYREIGLYKYATEHYKKKLDDIDDTSYKKYEALWNEQSLSGLSGKDPYVNSQINSLKQIMANVKIDDVLASKPIKGLHESDKQGRGLMTTGLEDADATKYVKLWNKMKTAKPGWSVDDFYLNVDESESSELYKTMIEFEKLHNKAYHNVHG